MKLVQAFVLGAFALLVIGCAPRQTTRPAPPPQPAAAPQEPSAPVPAINVIEPAAAPNASATEQVPKNRLPNPEFTPGKRSYRTIDQVCAKGSAKDERNVSAAEKTAVYEKYGIEKCSGYCSGKQGCEIDHLISLEIGGANTEDNLWPQPYDGDWNAHDKDILENTLHRLVCSKKLGLDEAQAAISSDWIAAFKKYVGTRKPHKPTNYCAK